MYIYTPGEPAGVPYQPGPDIDQPYLFASLNLFTRGRCGACKACPRVWKLHVPTGYGAGESTWAGDYYLRRLQYEYAFSGQQYPYINCAWTSRTAWQNNFCPIAGTNHNDFISSPDDPHGWVLVFMQGVADNRRPDAVNPYTWWLRTPYHEITGLYVSTWYYLPPPANRFSCLGSNTFRTYSPAGDLDFTYLPPELTITPFYA